MTSPNRFAMAPMTRSASPGGVPGENVAAYYRRRAAGGVGLIITEGVFIPHDAAGGQSNVPRLAGADSLAGWSAVTAAVHGEGSVIAAQLWHQGVERGVDPEFNPGVESVSPSGLAGDASPRGRALQTGELAPLAGSTRRPPAAPRPPGSTRSSCTVPTATCSTSSCGSAPMFAPTATVARQRSGCGSRWRWCVRYVPLWGRISLSCTGFRSGSRPITPRRWPTVPRNWKRLLAPLVDAGVDVFHPSTRRHYVPAFPELGAPTES